MKFSLTRNNSSSENNPLLHPNHDTKNYHARGYPQGQNQDQKEVSEDQYINNPSPTTSKKISWILLATLGLLTSGITVGVAPLKNAFLHSTPKNFSKQQMNIAFFIFLSLMTLVTYPVGLLLDWIGSRKLGLLAAIMQILGFATIGVITTYDLPGNQYLLVSAFIALGLANPAIFTSIIPLSGIFGPEWKEIVMALLTGLWDLGTIFAWILDIAVKYYHQYLNLSFIILTVLYMLWLAIAYLIYPDKDQLLITLQKYNVFVNISQTSHTSLTPPKMFGLTIMAASMLLHTNFYLTNVSDICVDLHLTGDHTADDIVSIFGIIFPGVGFFAAVTTGITMTKIGRKYSLLILLFIQLSFGILSNIPNIPLGLVYCVFTIYIILRMGSYTFINSVIALDSEPHEIGRNFGIIYGVAGLAGFLGFPLTLLSNTYRFWFVSIGLAALDFIATLFYFALELRHRST